MPVRQIGTPFYMSPVAALCDSVPKALTALEETNPQPWYHGSHRNCLRLSMKISVGKCDPPGNHGYAAKSIFDCI